MILCLIWGSTWMAIKIGLTDAPPLTAAALRFILATLILLAIASIKRYSFPRDLKGFVRLGYPGIHMYGLSYAFVYLAEQRINSSLAGVLFGVFPFFVALLMSLRYGTERLSLRAWLGMCGGFSGVILISYGSLQAGGDLFLGTLLAVAGAFAAAYGVVIHKQHFASGNIVVAATVQMVFGGLLLAVAAIILEPWYTFPFSPTTIGPIIYLALFGTVVAFLGYYWLLARARAVTVSLIAFVTPLIAILIGILYGQEQMTGVMAVGTALILSGIVLVVRAK
jgi:drug/metabolite transporter (DMT)-like permease